MNQPRVWWAGKEKGWVIDVEQPLSIKQFQDCIDYTLKVQSERFLSLLPGDRKDECALTMQYLKSGKVSQNIIGTGDKVLFEDRKSVV